MVVLACFVHYVPSTSDFTLIGEVDRFGSGCILLEGVVHLEKSHHHLGVTYIDFSVGHGLLVFLNSLVKRLIMGTIVFLANHGVAQTLKINLAGSNAFVTAYAVANLQDDQFFLPSLQE